MRLFIRNSWLWLLGALLAGRLFTIALFYLLPLPAGGRLVERPLPSIVGSFTIDAGVFAVGVALMLAMTLIPHGKRALYAAAGALVLLYFFLCIGDEQLRRWMGERLSFAFMSTYLGRGINFDPSITTNVWNEGKLSFILNLGTFAVLCLGFLWTVVRPFFCAGTKKDAYRALAVFCCVAAPCLSSPLWFGPVANRWKNVKPIGLVLADDALYAREHSAKPADYKLGISLLGGDSSAVYPFYKADANEQENVRRFIARPIGQKPDIILLVLESFDGWFGDLRNPASCRHLPNLCRLSHRGTFFPYAYSVGNPSTEGTTGIQMSVWSHPEKTIMAQCVDDHFRSLPDVLGSLGYNRVVLTGAEPSFDNFTPWFKGWFDSLNYDAGRKNDMPLADWFREIYNSRPADKPLFVTWMNATTHTPFMLPPGHGENSENWSKRYNAVTAYMDSAIGMLLSTVENGPRAANTLIFVTGDHAAPTGKQQELEPKLGLIGSSYAWTSLIVAGPGIPVDSIILRPVSHADIAPTVLSVLGTSVSNSFVGHDLFRAESAEYPVFSFRARFGTARYDGKVISAKTDDPDFGGYKSQISAPQSGERLLEGFVEEPDAGQGRMTQADVRAAANAWAYVLDHNLLFPAK